MQSGTMSLWAASLFAVSLAAAQPAAAAGEPTPAIHTTGTGEVVVAPDRAWVNLGVQATHEDLQAAQTEVDKTVQRFLALTDELGIARQHVQSAQLRVSPQYEWDDKPRRRNLVGYQVSRGLTVDLRDLDRLGALLTRSVKLGVNQSSGPRFDHTERDRLYREALGHATRDARAQAQAMASALGVQLGRALELTAQGHHRPQPVRAMAMRMASDSAEGAEQSYESGQIVVEAQVGARFAMD